MSDFQMPIEGFYPSLYDDSNTGSIERKGLAY
jgi:hypothetical protein